jgi:hypothetical protein
MFSPNTRQVDKDAVMQDMGIRYKAQNEKYLGLTIYMGKSKVQIFSYLKDRVWKQIQGSKEKLLSKAGNFHKIYCTSNMNVCHVMF